MNTAWLNFLWLTWFTSGFSVLKHATQKTSYVGQTGWDRRDFCQKGSMTAIHNTGIGSAHVKSQVQCRRYTSLPRVRLSNCRKCQVWCEKLRSLKEWGEVENVEYVDFDIFKPIASSNSTCGTQFMAWSTWNWMSSCMRGSHESNTFLDSFLPMFPKVCFILSTSKIRIWADGEHWLPGKRWL